jgi:hypothetical protein
LLELGKESAKELADEGFAGLARFAGSGVLVRVAIASCSVYVRENQRWREEVAGAALPSPVSAGSGSKGLLNRAPTTMPLAANER